MATRTLTSAGRSVAVLAAGAVTAGVLAVGAVAPATAAETGPVAGAGTAAVSAKQAATQKAKKGKRGKDGSLKAAKRAEKKARARVEALLTQKDDAEGAAISPTNQYNAAVREETAAKTDAAENQKKVDRGKYLLVPANQNTLYLDISTRAQPAVTAENAARDQWDAAKAVVTSLNNQVGSLQTDINAAYNSSTAVFNEINDLQYNRIPAVQAQYGTALSDEQAAWNQKEYYREDLARRKAQWTGGCRITLGRYECRDSGQPWQYVPKLDEVQAALDQWQAIYNQRKNQRQDIEGYLGSLNNELAGRQAEHANIINLINGLTSQKDAVQAKIPGANAAVDAAYAAYQEKVRATDVFRKEFEALVKEIEAAKTNLPTWEAAQARYNKYLTDATAKVAAVAPAYQQATGKVAEVNEALAKAREVLKKAVKRVKDIRKGRGR